MKIRFHKNPLDTTECIDVNYDSYGLGLKAIKDSGTSLEEYIEQHMDWLSKDDLMFRVTIIQLMEDIIRMISENCVNIEITDGN